MLLLLPIMLLPPLLLLLLLLLLVVDEMVIGVVLVETHSATHERQEIEGELLSLASPCVLLHERLHLKKVRDVQHLLSNNSKQETKTNPNNPNKTRFFKIYP